MKDGRTAARPISPRAISCGTSKISTWPRLPTQASAEFVVPRSMPIASGASVVIAFPDIQLEFPALTSIPGNAPELQCAEFGDIALERHRHRRIVAALEPQS